MRKVYEITSKLSLILVKDIIIGTILFLLMPIQDKKHDKSRVVIGLKQAEIILWYWDTNEENKALFFLFSST